jgi:pyridoxal phosphate enzyme (YggS family)
MSEAQNDPQDAPEQSALDDSLLARLRRNLERVQARIEAACTRAGRDPGELRLIAVTKYSTGIETAAMAQVMAELEPGRRPLLGESRIQDLLQKIAFLEEAEAPAEFHLIGNLQRNKARSAVKHAQVIHSMDRPEILERVDKMAADEGRRVRALLQFELSGESSKHGFAAEQAEAAFAQARALEHVDFVGLMAMAGRGTDHETARPCFAQLRELRDRYAADWPELSMGMSGDFEGAILEGATLIRVGSALFVQDDT